MKIIEGDLIQLAFDGKFDVIVHQCNCFHNFGAGIALQILKQCPSAYEADRNTTIGSKSKLGTISVANVANQFVVVNGYSQYHCGRGKIHTEYYRVKQVFELVKLHFSGKRIGYPLYGAGLAGGDWNIISKIIDEQLDGEDHTLVKWRK